MDVASVANDLAAPLELAPTSDLLRPPLDFEAAIAADFFAVVVRRVAKSVLRPWKAQVRIWQAEVRRVFAIDEFVFGQNALDLELSASALVYLVSGYEEEVLLLEFVMRRIEKFLLSAIPDLSFNLDIGWIDLRWKLSLRMKVFLSHLRLKSINSICTSLQ